MDKKKICQLLKIAVLVLVVTLLQKNIYKMNQQEQQQIHYISNISKYETQENGKLGIEILGDSLMELELVITFPLLTDPKFDFHGIHKNDDNVKMKEDRMKEYMECLMLNLRHRYVSRIHLLYDQPNLVNYVKSRVNPQLQKKLEFHRILNTTKTDQIFKFIFSTLKGKLVMYMQADNYLGDGFDRINKEWLSQKRLMFALTRWGQLERKCDMKKNKVSNTCSQKLYRGSHDGYIFVPQEPLTESALKKLDATTFHLGIDNLIIYVFKILLKYRVSNPCLVLKIYHLHCTNLRNASRKHRVFYRNVNSSAIPTDYVL